MDEKRKALEKQCYYNSVNCKMCALYDASKDGCSISGADFDECSAEQIDELYAKMFPTPSSMDYEAEYHKLLAEKEKLEKENEYLKREMAALSAENTVMREKLDMVYLIFGGRNR